MNALFSTSLQMLWGMVNSLQIIVHMPLCAIAFPGLSKMLMLFLAKVANFEII